MLHKGVAGCDFGLEITEADAPDDFDVHDLITVTDHTLLTICSLDCVSEYQYNMTMLDNPTGFYRYGFALHPVAHMAGTC